MVTYGDKETPHSRPMTNLNKTPYERMWFPSFRNTRKEKDIKHNNKVLILFPDKGNRKFYEIEGTGSFASQKEVDDRWIWWYLYWHPEQEQMFWFSPDSMHNDRCIINVDPVGVKTLSMDDVKYIHDEYRTVIPS